MATLRKRGARWQVQVRRQGFPPLSRTFALKEDAVAWGHATEHSIGQGMPPAPQQPTLGNKTLADLLQKYLDEVTPMKRGKENETICLKAFMAFDISQRKLSALTPADFAAFRDQRLKDVQANSFNRQISRVQNAYDVAIREWNWPIKENPLRRIRKPRNERGRERRFQESEWESLVMAIGKTRNPLIQPIVSLALETGMRQSEILNIEWAHFNAEKKSLLIPITKNGEPRTIPLSSIAIDILNAYQGKEGKIFPITQEAVKQAWNRLVDRAGIENLHFHDLRHEAISRFFEKGLSIPEVALISGHKDYRMLFRYTHLKPEDIANKLN